MGEFPSLRQYLNGWSGDDLDRRAVATTIESIATAAATVSDLIARGPLAGALDAVVGHNADGDAQKALDIRANDLFIAALEDAPVAVLGSEENETALVLNDGAPLAVAIDPLDGSSNIDTNVSMGTIFSILEMTTAAGEAPESALFQSGTDQLAAGFVIYGPQTALVLTVRQGTHIFTFDPARSAFVLTRADVRIPTGKPEYAINASNYRYWNEPIRMYVDDCISGTEGPRGVNFNMRWIASLVAEAFRILIRGGIFLYPRDTRPGYQNGRLRLLYEANPISLLIEQANGAATDGQRRILDILPRDLHQRVPFIFGSRDKIERVTQYHSNPLGNGERSPLFGRRGLFRV